MTTEATNDKPVGQWEFAPDTVLTVERVAEILGYANPRSVKRLPIKRAGRVILWRHVVEYLEGVAR